MAKKSSGSSRPARLKKMTSEDIKGRTWTEKERRSLRGIAQRQLAGEDLCRPAYFTVTVS